MARLWCRLFGHQRWDVSEGGSMRYTPAGFNHNYTRVTHYLCQRCKQAVPFPKEAR